MKVSVIIPVYNVSKYIERCLSSVVSQTWPDIECLLVDDCGTDDSMDRAQRFIEGYTDGIEFTILRHDKNKGQAAARNTALRLAKGEYVFFLDSDDAIPTDCIETLMTAAIKHPMSDYVQGNLHDSGDAISKFVWHDKLPECCNDHDELERYILSVVVASAWNKVIKRSFLTSHSLYFPEGIIHEDLYWTFFLAKYAKEVSFVDAATYIYCLNENSTVTAVSPHARVRRYSSRLVASEAFCADIDSGRNPSRCVRHFIAGNLTCAMIEVAALHSPRHWLAFWRHVVRLYVSHKRLTLWQHILFLFMMPPLCFPIGIKGWYWRLQRYVVNNI